MAGKRIALLLFGLIIAVGLMTPAVRADEEDFFDAASLRRWKVYQWDTAHTRLRATFPYSIGSSGAAFDFLETPDTAYFITRHPFYNGLFLGDMTDKSIFVGLRAVVTAGTEFTYYGAPHLCPEPPDVRFYFETDHHGPLFDETDYWWSAGSPELTFAGVLVAPMTSSAWVDAKGHLATMDSAHELAFAEAVQNVKAFGLSFGGGCGFGNGVGIRPGTGSGYFLVQGIGANPAP